MAVAPQNGKRKRIAAEVETATAKPEIPQNMALEMSSEDEAEEDDSDDDVVPFPEIDVRSDSEEDGDEVEEEGEGSEDDSEEEEEDEDDEGNESEDITTEDDDELNIFPKSKSIISKITGQPKTVYPEIEPEYDSDSSTEDVCFRMYCASPFSSIYNVTGSKSRRKHTNALV